MILITLLTQWHRKIGKKELAGRVNKDVMKQKSKDKASELQIKGMNFVFTLL